MRALVAADTPLTQGALGALVGVTQPRVSQILAMLAQQAAVRQRPTGYLGNRRQLIDLYVTHHAPALSSAESAWYSLAPQSDAVRSVVSQAAANGIRVAVSADLAADLITPWRHPTLTVVYAARDLDLSDAGFVPAEGRVDAIIVVRTTPDTTLLQAFEPWPRTANNIPLADPLQQIWDLNDLGGHDRVDHAKRLATAVLRRNISAWSPPITAEPGYLRFDGVRPHRAATSPSS